MENISCGCPADILVDYREYIPYLLEHSGSLTLTTNEFIYRQTTYKKRGLFGKTDTHSTFDSHNRHDSRQKAIEFCKQHSLSYSFDSKLLSEKKTDYAVGPFSCVTERDYGYRMSIQIPDSKKLLSELGIDDAKTAAIASTSFVRDLAEKLKESLAEDLRLQSESGSTALSLSGNLSALGIQFSTGRRYVGADFAAHGFARPNFPEGIMLLSVFRSILTAALEEDPHVDGITGNTFTMYEGSGFSIQAKLKPSASLQSWC